MFRSLIPRMSWEPLSISRHDRDLPSLLEQMLGPDGDWPSTSSRFVPLTNISETDKAVEVTVELPGLKSDEFNVELNDNELSISGEKKDEKEEKGKNYHRVERHYGSFRRSVTLPSTVNKEEIEAEFNDGVLKVTLPKCPEAKPKAIEIKT